MANKIEALTAAFKSQLLADGHQAAPAFLAPAIGVTAR
jgi:hypothetical protein